MTTAAASGRWPVPLFFGASLALHAALFAALLTVHPASERRATPVSVDIVETRPASAPPPAPEPAPEPSPSPKLVRRLAKIPPPPKDAPSSPPQTMQAPPPPNAEAADSAQKSAPIHFGVPMSATTTAGGLAAPVGNSLYGQVPKQAPDPKSVQPYRAEHYAPPTQVTTLPVCTCEVPKSEYPAEAAKEGREGQVKLRLLVDEQGRVQEAVVLRDPGFGFGAAAMRSAKQWCRCKPATKDGAAVATEISPFTFTFELP